MIITAGTLKGQKILTPPEEITRPTLSKVRMAVFNALNNMIDFEGKTFLDMFAGSGIMGLEAVSRGFGNVIAIENNKKVFNILKTNYQKLNIDGQLICSDSIKVLKKGLKFDVVYIDPPYFSGVYENSLEVVKNAEIIIVEHVEALELKDFNVLKQKKYGEKLISFLKY